MYSNQNKSKDDWVNAEWGSSRVDAITDEYIESAINLYKTKLERSVESDNYPMDLFVTVREHLMNGYGFQHIQNTDPRIGEMLVIEIIFRLKLAEKLHGNKQPRILILDETNRINKLEDTTKAGHGNKYDNYPYSEHW